MSVLKRNRSESQLEFYNTAITIRAELTKFVMNEKIIPKRWRPVFTFPLVSMLIKLINNITAANTIYPQKPKTNAKAEWEAYLQGALKRREYQTEAVITVEQIFQHLQYILTTLPVDANKFRPVTQLLVKEAQLLRGWRKADYKFIKDYEERGEQEATKE